MLGEIEVAGSVDIDTWRVFWKLVDRGEAAQAIRTGDLGINLEPAASSHVWLQRDRKVFGEFGVTQPVLERMPVRMRSKPLWVRETQHKRRHYFDVASLYVKAAQMWEEEGCGSSFRATAKKMLFEAVKSGMGYERLYLTMFWVWTCPYWADLALYLLQSNLLYATDVQWRAIGKETTAQVARSWFFPLTTKQHIVSAYMLNTEDLVGYPDGNPDAGAVALEILDFATNEFEYTYPVIGAEDRHDFASYLREYETAVESFLEPLYSSFSDKASTFEDMLATRAAWADWVPQGVSERRAREVLGEQVVPKGSSKEYVMAKSEASVYNSDWGTTYVEAADKSDERGATRTIVATDMRDQLTGKVAFRCITNRYAEVGLDIGESPVQAMARYIHPMTATEGKDGYIAEDKALLCWNWQVWDHFVHCAERKLMLHAMRTLTERHIREPQKADMLTELDKLIAGTEALIFRSQSYADERYRAAVDEIIVASEGQARRLPRHTGKYAVYIEHPNGQQSGRSSRLEDNTITGTARLRVRDSELLGRTASLRHRTSLFVCNRADDVTEVFRRYQDAVAAVSTLLEQGHRANKKQVVQWRSMVYLRTLYAGGSVRAFPARSVYAAATAHPDKGEASSGDDAFYEKLRSISKGLDMWAWRGGFMRMAEVLYEDARKFFSRTRIWLPKDKRAGKKQHFRRVRVPPEVLAAAPENGGLGILPPGQYNYDYTIKCSAEQRLQVLQLRAQAEGVLEGT